MEAEVEGARYNVPAGQITRTLTYLGDVTISNSAGWITREGSDTEDDESARERTLRSWSELALVPLRDTYINVCSAIAGVLYVTVKDQHPRGRAPSISSSPQRPGRPRRTCWKSAGWPVRRYGNRTRT